MAAAQDIEYLYKYRSIDGEAMDWIRCTLVANTVRFSSIRDFNDPFDCRPVYAFEGSREELRRYASALISRRSADLPRNERRQMLKYALNESSRRAWIASLSLEMRRLLETNLGVYCLSEVPDNILMWGHYANCHRGIVLRFKATSTTPFFGGAQPVAYHSLRPVVNPVRQTHDEQVEAGVLSKASDWVYEKEWRILDHDNGPGIRQFPSSLLDGVILGACIRPDAEAQIRDFLSKRSTPTAILKARIDEQTFGLSIAP